MASMSKKLVVATLTLRRWEKEGKKLIDGIKRSLDDVSRQD